MKIATTATIEHLRTLDAGALRNVWYSAHYHPSRYAIGKGRKGSSRALMREIGSLVRAARRS